jgi:hypothetical protein
MPRRKHTAPRDPVPWATWAFRRLPAALVYNEFWYHGRRVVRCYDDMTEARTAYIQAHCEGRDPTVVRVAL